MAYPFFSLAKSKRLAPVDFRAGSIAIRVEALPEHGMATIWDADVLIWAASQIVHARDAGLRASRLMAATPYEILTFVGRGAGARDYQRLKPASTGSGRPRSRPRYGNSPNVAAIASPGSTSGRKRPTPTVGRSGSN
jgi:Replication initiator protein A